VGDGIANVALVIYVQRVEGSGSAVGLLLLMTMLPSCLAPFTGVVVDRFDRRRVLVTGEAVQAVLALIVAVWLPGLAPLLVLIFLKSIAATVCDIAGRSAIPSVVDDDGLVAANAWFGGARQAADVIGPVLGGVLVAAASVRTALGVDVATFAVGVPLLLRLPALTLIGTDGGREGGGNWLTEARAGLRYLAQNRVARAVTIGFLILGLTGADDVALPFLARELGSGDVGIGVLYAAVAVGLVAGFALLARGRFPMTPAAGFVGGCVIVGVGETLTGIAGAIALAVIFQMVRGVGTAAIDVNLQTLLQRSVAPEMLGRVFANVYGAVGIAAAVSVGVAGPFLDATSPGTVLVATGLAAFAAAATTALLLRRP
jgi:MFS family permease